jgi:hypothetical protein
VNTSFQSLIRAEKRMPRRKPAAAAMSCVFE